MGAPESSPPLGELSEDRGYEPARVSGVDTKGGRSTNGHFVSKLFSDVGTLDRLTHYVAPRYTKRTEGRAE